MILCVMLAFIYSGVVWPQLWRFSKGDYMHLQYDMPTTFDVKAWCTILHVKDVLPNGILLLEGTDGWKC